MTKTCEWAQKNDQFIVDSVAFLERIQSDKFHSIEYYIKKMVGHSYSQMLA